MVLQACRGYLGNPCSPFFPHLFSTLPIILFSPHLFSTLSRYIGLTEQYDKNSLNILGSLQLSALYLFLLSQSWVKFLCSMVKHLGIYVTLSEPWLCICVFLCGRTLDLPPLFLVLLPELWAHKICRLWPVCVIEVMLVVLAESAQFMVALRQQSVPWIFHMWNKWVWWKMRTHSTKAVGGRTQVTLEVHIVKLAFANRPSAGYQYEEKNSPKISKTN